MWRERGGQSLVMATLAEAPRPASCPESCRRYRRPCFTLSQTRMMLQVLWQAKRYNEDAVEILKSRTRSSANNDPWNRLGGFDPNRARDLLISLEMACKRHGVPLDSRLAHIIAPLVCPDRWAEE